MKTMIVLAALALAAPAWPSGAQETRSHNWMQPLEMPSSNRLRMRYMTGNDFLAQCQNSRVACSTYIQGVNDTLLAASVGTNRDVPYCIPIGSTISQITDVVLAYLRDHPEHRHLLAAELIAAALATVWPQCTVGLTPN